MGSAPPPLDAEAWVFDLDNTLYPTGAGLFEQVEPRMGRFIEERFGLDAEDARRVQKQGFRDHGSTMRFLMLEHGIAPRDFLDYVHDIDYGVLKPDPQLDAALARIAGRKFVFTNAAANHARRVLDRLGITHHFAAVFDIADADWQPKPMRAGYDRLIAQQDLDAPRTVMIEDIARNLAPAAALGMTTVWLRTNRHGWATDGADDGHIDHVIDDLAGWLRRVAPRR